MREAVPLDLEEAVQRKFEAEYEHITYKAAGGTAYVWRMVKKDIGQARILKVLKPDLDEIVVTDENGVVTTRSLAEICRREAQYILALSHEHIIRLYDIGELEVPKKPPICLPYYIVENVEGGADLVEFLTKRHKDNKLTETDFVGLLTALASAVNAAHKKRIGHGDIKPGNILVDTDGLLKLADFGFAKSLDELENHPQLPTLCYGDQVTMPAYLKARMARQVAQRRSGSAVDSRAMAVALMTDELQPLLLKFDLVRFGLTVKYLLDECGMRPVLAKHEGFIELVCQRLINSVNGTHPFYENAEQLLADLRKLQTGYAVEGVFDEFSPYPRKGIPIPLRGRLPKTPRLCALVDHPIVRRLRHVRQLGLSHHVFPGATHSRFEHSLGTFALTMQYVRALWRTPDHSYFRQVATEADIAALLVAALLHDVGHFPMAHAFEEIEPTKSIELRHDSLTERILLGDVPAILSLSDAQGLNEKLKKEWGVSVNDVIAIQRGIISKAENVQKGLVNLLHSIIDGPIDTDKVDYLRRDSLHTDFPAGLNIDEYELIRNIVAPEGAQAIGLRESGVPAAETLLAARYRMYRRVYWNRNCRGLERMLTEAVRLIRYDEGETFSDEFQRKAFAPNTDDEQLLRVVAAWLPNQKLRDDLISPLMASGDRSGWYTRLITIAAGGLEWKKTKRDPMLYDKAMTLFGEHIEGGMGRWRFQFFDIALRRRLLKLAEPSILKSHEIVVDLPDPRGDQPVKDNQPTPASFLVYTTRESAGTDASSLESLLSSLVKKWRVDIRKIRVFGSPAAAHALEDKDVQGEFASALDEAAALPHMKEDDWKPFLKAEWEKLQR